MSIPPQPPNPPAAQPPTPQPSGNLPAQQNDGGDPAPNPKRSDEETPIPPELAKFFESVPEEKRAEVFINLLQQFEVHESPSMSMAKMFRYSGPLPHPEIIRGINEVVPGAGREIIDMAIAQSAHRRNLELTALTSQTGDSKRGQRFGFIIAMFGLAGAFVLVLLGHEWPGVAVGGFDLAALVSVFVLGQKAQKKDLEKKKGE
jgi:uncharacterized membrane protein